MREESSSAQRRALHPLKDRHQGIRVSNLDSAEQQRMWDAVTAQIQAEGDDIDIAQLWNASSHTALRLLHAHPEYYQYLAGVLRTAYLKDTSIVCTWPEIIDGIFMLAVGPHDVHNILGLSYRDKPPIIIRGNAPTFPQMLLKFFIAETDSAHHSPRHLKTPQELKRSALTPLLEHKHFTESDFTPISTALPEPADEPERIFQRLRELHEQAFGFREGELSLLEKRWNDWNQAINSGLVRYEFFDITARPLNVPETMKQFLPIAQRFITSIDSDFVFDEREFTQLFCNYRSKTFHRITEKFAQLSSSQAQALQDACTDFYQFIYQLAIAEQHDTEWISVKVQNEDEQSHTTDTHNCFIEYMSEHPRASRKTLDDTAESSSKEVVSHAQLQFLAGASSKILSHMPAVEFTSFCYNARASIECWRSGDLQHVADIDYAISRANETHSREDDLKTLKRGGLLSLGLALVSWFFDQNEHLLPDNISIWLVPITALALTVLPEAINLFEEWKSLRGDTQTLVFSPQETLE
ncbi:hypothetical protein [Alloscardovia criceti]|uniref:hypothetical protein n=1 Tax=Alloscardovia criceti TaxID=356828 RepID=UPI0003AB3D68|nr:hypothetical protein [Alloscardovia criceti]